MTDRRSFLKYTGLMAGGLFLSSDLAKAALRRNGKYPYKAGLQLYTVRDAMAKDPKGSLARVAQVGYLNVEHATYSGTEKFYGMSPSEFLAVLRQNNLHMPSGHYALGSPSTKGTILADWDRAAHDAAAVGQKYMVCAYLPEEARKTIDDYKRLSDVFNKAGETCKKAGIQFCYHNHNFEFPKLGGQVPYEVLIKSTDPGLVKMEMDIYWVTRAGYDPIALFNEHPGRFILWHVKDMDNTPQHAFTEVGSGVIDWNRIFAHAKESGMKEFFVEEDKCPGDPFVSIRESYQYLKKNIIA
jgi:sugar phosphate isomerase/epimerase